MSNFQLSVIRCMACFIVSPCILLLFSVYTGSQGYKESNTISQKKKENLHVFDYGKALDCHRAIDDLKNDIHYRVQ